MAAGGNRSAREARAAQLSALDKFTRCNRTAGRRRSSRFKLLPLHLLKKRGKKREGEKKGSVNRSVPTLAGEGCCEHRAWKLAAAELDPAPAALRGWLGVTKLQMGFMVPDG